MSKVTQHVCDRPSCMTGPPGPQGSLASCRLFYLIPLNISPALVSLRDTALKEDHLLGFSASSQAAF